MELNLPTKQTVTELQIGSMAWRLKRDVEQMQRELDLKSIGCD